MANTSQPYLAPSLKDKGYTGSTGTTPFRPATGSQLSNLQDLYVNSPAKAAPTVISATATVLNINFDGTQNNGNFTAPGETPTNVFEMQKLQAAANGEDNTIYLPGVGAQTAPAGTTLSNGNPAPGSSPSNWDSIPSNAGTVATSILNSAYRQLTDRIDAIRATDPTSEISLNLSGFSRGAAEAVAFANLLNERGIPGVYPSGQVPVDTMVLFDPVSQTNGQLNTEWPTNVKSNLVFVAMDEGRPIMPAMPLGGDANVVPVTGAHSDIGGSYNSQGISAVTLGLAREFQASSGAPIAEVPVELQPDWAQMNIHNPSLDNYGNQIWGEFQSQRIYEGAKLGSPSVQDAVLNGAYLPTPTQVNPAAGDAINYQIPADPAYPDGAQLTVVEATDRLGHTTLTVRDASGQTVLSTQNGETLSRDPSTGKLSVMDKQGLETGSFTPPTQPAPTVEAPSTTTGGDFEEALIDAFNNAPTNNAQLAEGVQYADAGGTTGNNAVVSDAGGGDSFAEGGSALNQPLTPAEYAQTAPETISSISPTPTSSTPFVQYGSQYNATLQPLNAALNLLQGLDNLQHWDQMDDLGHFNSLLGLANSINTVSDGAIGNLGSYNTIASTISLAQSIENGNLLGTLSSINGLSDQAIDGALNSALGSTGVPYLSIAIALNDFEHHPGQSMGALVGMAWGPLGSAIGGTIGGLLDGAGLFGGGGTPPPPRGEVHFAWDTAGVGGAQPMVSIVTDANVSNGAMGARQVAGQLLDSVLHAIEQSNAQTMRDHPQTPPGQLLALNANMLPSVLYDKNQVSLGLPNPDGATSFFVNLDDPDAMVRVLQLLQDNGGIAPQWMVDTQYQRFENLVHTGASASDIEREITAGKSGLVDQSWSQAAAITGGAGESADFKTQTFESLVVHAQGAQVQLSRTLRNIDIDDFLETTQWVSATDAQGNLQGLLVLDYNGNGQIETRDILNLGGNRGQSGAKDAQLLNEYADLQRNNVQWLDANGDGLLDKSDPAFAAIKLWVDLNQDGQTQSGEAYGTADLEIVAIDYSTGKIRYTHGQEHALSEQSLTGATSGHKLTQVYQIDNGQRINLMAGDVLADEGYKGQTETGAIRMQTFEHQTLRTGDWEGTVEQDQHRHGGGNVDGAPTETDATGATDLGAPAEARHLITQSTLTENDARMTSDVPPPMANSQATSQTITPTVIAAGDIRIRSSAPSPVTTVTSISARATGAPLAFVPLGQTSVQGQTLAVTQSMIESSQSSLFGAGANAGLGVLAAVGLGAVQSAQATGSEAIADSTLNANIDGMPLVVDSSSGYDSYFGSSRPNSTVSAAPSVVFGQVDLGVFNVATNSVTTPFIPPTATDTQASDTAPVPSADPLPVAPTLLSASVFMNAALPASANSESPTPASASPFDGAALVTLDYPKVQGETLPGTEDVVLRLPQSILLTNDSTVNASANPSQSPLSITAVSEPVHGQVSLVNGEVLFVPEANYFGTASFFYTVTDQYGFSRTATATLQIAAVNDTPVARADDAGTTLEDTALHISTAHLLANDTDADSSNAQWGGVNDVLSVNAVGNPTHGTVALVRLPDGSTEVVFTPDANYHGPASFVYQVLDAAGAVSQAVATYQITGVNDVPVATGETIATPEDRTLLIAQAALLQNDTDSDLVTDPQVLSVSAVFNAQNGTVSILRDGTIAFVPDADFFGTASFDYTVSDGAGGTATASAVLEIANVNDAPVPLGETIQSQEDAVLTITAASLLQNDMDIDSLHSTLKIARVESGTHGRVSLNANGDVVFTPEANYNNTDASQAATFTYWVQDADGAESAPVTAKVMLSAVNDAPVAQGESLSGASEDAIFNISSSLLIGNDSDIDDANSALSLSWVGGANGGAVSLDANGNVVFTPNANFNGNASFSYRVRDAAGLESATVQAIIPVAAVNDRPLAVDDQFKTYTNSTVSIAFSQLTSNDTDAEAEALTVSAVRGAEHGVVSIVNGQVQFVPTTGFKGTASFEYLSDDQHGGQTWATVFVDVIAPPQYATVSVTLGCLWIEHWHHDAANLRQTFNYSIEDESPGTVSMEISPNFGADFTYAGYGSVQWSNATDFNIWKYDVYGNANISLDLKLTDESGLSNTTHVYVQYSVVSGFFGQAVSVAQFQVWHDHTGFATPVVLALNSDSASYISTQYSRVSYDIDLDGVSDKIAWAAPGSGVLGLDLNGDHQISNVSEFAFRQYVDGAQTDLEGLRAFDTNANGVLDAGDAQWAQFGVWEDKNADGQTQDGEYLTLDALGIATINLQSDAQMHSGAAVGGGASTDVTVMGTTTFAWTDGRTGAADDAMFAYQSGIYAQAADADLARMALLFNQISNTALSQDTLPLGFVPLQPVDAAMAQEEPSTLQAA